MRDRIGHLGVIATTAAYELGAEWLQATLAVLDANRHVLASMLADQLPQIGYRIPDATYHAWLDCRALSFGDDPARTFIDAGKVALASGPDFGVPGRGLRASTSAQPLTCSPKASPAWRERSQRRRRKFVCYGCTDGAV